MRWDQSLTFTCVELPAEINITGDNGLGMDLRIQQDEYGLTVCFGVSGRPFADIPEFFEWYWNDHVVFFFDFDHDHMTENMFAVTRHGDTIHKRSIVIQGEEVSDILKKELPGDNSIYSADITQGDQEWEGVLTVDNNVLTSGIIGFCAKAVSGLNPVSSAVFPERADMFSHEIPLGYADLYVADNVPSVRGIDFREPEWKQNTGVIECDRKGTEEEHKIISEFCFGEKTITCTKEGEGGTIEFDYELHFRGKWSSDISGTSVLKIQVMDSSQGCWEGSFPVGFDCGIIARDRTGDSKKARPEPDDKDFRKKMREYLISNLPDFARISGSNSSESDFCIYSRELGRTFDLTDSEIFRQIAELIASIFNRWDDGLAACSVLLGSSAGVRHSSSGAGFAGALNPEGILQLGRGFCNQEAKVFAALADRLAEYYNREWQTFHMGLRGHIVAAVFVEGDYIVYDPMLGIFFPGPDNTRPATLEELRQHKNLSHSMDEYCSAHDHEFYYNIDHHIIHPFTKSGASITD